MNRRSFISTLTTLLGVVLARIKAPAAPVLQRPRLTATAAQIASGELPHVQRFNVPVLTSFAPKGVTPSPNSAGYSLNLCRFITMDEAKAMIRLDNPTQ